MNAKPADGKYIDHIDRNKLNNQKSNLRFCNQSINIHNSKMYSNNTSGIRGVTWHKKQERWYARAWVNQKLIYLGKYADKQGAIDARQAFNKQMGAPNTPVQDKQQAGADSDVQA